MGFPYLDRLICDIVLRFTWQLPESWLLITAIRATQTNILALERSPYAWPQIIAGRADRQAHAKTCFVKLMEDALKSRRMYFLFFGFERFLHNEFSSRFMHVVSTPSSVLPCSFCCSWLIESKHLSRKFPTKVELSFHVSPNYLTDFDLSYKMLNRESLKACK